MKILKTAWDSTWKEFRSITAGYMVRSMRCRLRPACRFFIIGKDLFESPICKRTYFEQFHEELQPPKTFEEYNRIAAFFTRDLTPSSPVPYGSTITLGSTGVAGSEFLARLFAIQENLYGADGQIHLDSCSASRLLRS